MWNHSLDDRALQLHPLFHFTLLFFHVWKSGMAILHLLYLNPGRKTHQTSKNCSIFWDTKLIESRLANGVIPWARAMSAPAEGLVLLYPWCHQPANFVGKKGNGNSSGTRSPSKTNASKWRKMEKTQQTKLWKCFTSDSSVSKEARVVHS